MKLKVVESRKREEKEKKEGERVSKCLGDKKCASKGTWK